jgi:hypothetical protein
MTEGPVTATVAAIVEVADLLRVAHVAMLRAESNVNVAMATRRRMHTLATEAATRIVELERHARAVVAHDAVVKGKNGE